MVLEIAREIGIPVREEAMADRDLSQLDELFLVGTTSDVMPIVRVDDVVIGKGAPGPIARRLQEEFRAHMDAASAHAPA